jgi:hypothetical protein
MHPPEILLYDWMTNFRQSSQQCKVKLYTKNDYSFLNFSTRVLGDEKLKKYLHIIKRSSFGIYISCSSLNNLKAQFSLLNDGF